MLGSPGAGRGLQTCAKFLPRPLRPFKEPALPLPLQAHALLPCPPPPPRISSLQDRVLPWETASSAGFDQPQGQSLWKEVAGAPSLSPPCLSGADSEWQQGTRPPGSARIPAAL